MSRLRPLWPCSVLLLFALLAAEPLARAAMTCSDDGSSHLYRAVQLDWLIQAGHWIPRWAPHMAQGFGYPLFIFTAPLSSYFVVAIHSLGLEFPLALRLAFAVTIWLAGCAAFTFARAVWGERAGLAAGVAYAFAPYFALDILYRGNFAETLAFVWLPLILWGLQRLARRPHSLRALIIPALAFGALSLTHNAFAFLAAPLVFGYAISNAWLSRSWRMGMLGVASLLLGALLSAFYWVPAVFEQSLVYTDRLAVPPIFTWYTNFIEAGELLAAPRAEDPLLINPSPANGLGLTAALLCLPALGALADADRSRRWITGFFLAALAGYAGLTLPISEPVWRLVSPLQVVQFPWRMLGPAALCAALCLAAGVHTLERVRAFGRWPALMIIALFVLGNWSAWYPRYCPGPEAVGLQDLIEHERATATLGTTAKGEFLPRTVAHLPEDASLADAILRGEEPVRLRVAAGEAKLGEGDANDPLEVDYGVVAHTRATLEYGQFLYPGWQVTANGQPVAVRPAAGTGLITFDLPAGTHALRITFGSTPLRTAASLISLVAVLALVALALHRRTPSPETPPPAERLWDLGVLAIGLLVLRLAVVDRVPNPLRYTRFDGASVAGVQTPLRVDFAGGYRLYGYDLGARTLPADGSVEAALYASKREPNIREVTPVLVLHDRAGANWVGADATLPPRWHRSPPPSPNWPDDAYAQWARRVTVLPGTPPGAYELKLELIDRSNGAMQSVLDDAGNAVQPRLSLGPLTVSRPSQPFALQPEIDLKADFGPLTLLGFAVDRTTLNAGDTASLTLYWRSDAAVADDYAARLRLGDFDLELPPVSGYGTSQWQPGDEWRGQHRVTLPATLPGGVYSLELSLASITHTLGTLTVNAPVRTFEAPAFDHAVEASFAGVGNLIGYTLARDGKRLTVRLAWKATATPAQRYAVFVHLGDATRVWAQSDSPPAGGARPTTGWLAGEYIVDEHALDLPDDLPAGDYTLYVGLYDPQTNIRAPAEAPGVVSDRVPIGPFTWP